MLVGACLFINKDKKKLFFTYAFGVFFEKDIYLKYGSKFYSNLNITFGFEILLLLYSKTQRVPQKVGFTFQRRSLHGANT